MPKSRIGLLGGTYDPVHLGHIGIANATVKRLNLDCCYLLPCKSPVHKPDATATAEQRQHMLTLALQDQPNLAMDNREILRDSPSYTIDTTSAFRQEHPDAALFWIIGADAFATFTEWHNWPAILDQVNIAVIARGSKRHQPPADPRLISVVTTLDELGTHGQIAFFEDCPTFPYASSDIRQAVAKGKISNQPLPSAVKDYIRAQTLYS